MAMERWGSLGTTDRWEPFRHVNVIQSEVNRLFDSFLGRPLAGATAGGRVWMPPIDNEQTAQ